MTRNAVLKTALLVLTLFVLAQCGDKGETNSDKIALTVFPKSPVVINQPYPIIDPGDNSKVITISANWFRTAVTIKNSHPTHAAVILMLQYESTGFDSSGIQASATGVVTPATLIPSSAASQLAVLAPGEQAVITFFAQSLPTSVTSLIYRVKISALGWFSAPDDADLLPVANLKQDVTVTTANVN